MKQRRTDLNGLIVVDKPEGWSSMDVVRKVRSAAGGAKAGHAGTLDPLATGVVIGCLGRATKAVDRLMALPKVYEATVDLSAFTSTDDREGEREPVDVAEPPDEGTLRAALDGLTGDVEQVPPAHSAVKVGGQRAYALARSGQTVETPTRVVRIRSIRLDRYVWPEATVTVDCGKGTYLRSLARQIGERLGTGGHITTLRRTAVGPYTADRAVPAGRVPRPLSPSHLLPIPQEESAGERR